MNTDIVPRPPSKSLDPSFEAMLRQAAADYLHAQKLWQVDQRNNRPQSPELSRQAGLTEGYLMGLTEGLNAHPEWFEFPCLCDECRTCG